MTKILYGIIVISIIATMLNAKDYYHKTTDRKKIAWMDKGKKLVKEKLKDGETAKFKNVYFIVGSIGVPTTCGEVNAKNSYGGFTGYKKFISAGRLEFTFLQSEVSDFNNLWRQMCE